MSLSNRSVSYRIVQEILRHASSRTTQVYSHVASSAVLTLHGLRHGFYSRLVEKGAPTYTIQPLARHDSLESSMKYIYLSNRMLKDDLDEAFS